MSEQSEFLTTEVAEQEVAPKRNTPLTSLKDALAKKVVKAPVTLSVPARDGVTMRFNTNLEQSLLEAWRSASTRRGKRGKEDEINMLSLASKILFGQNEAILFNGEEEYGEDQTLISLRHRELAEMLGAESTTPIGICQALYGYDAHIVVAMEEVLVACGYSPDIDMETEEDPTNRS